MAARAASSQPARPSSLHLVARRACAGTVNARPATSASAASIVVLSDLHMGVGRDRAGAVASLRRLPVGVGVRRVSQGDRRRRQGRDGSRS